MAAKGKTKKEKKSKVAAVTTTAKKDPKGIKITKEFEFAMSKDERIKIAETAHEHELEAQKLSLQFEEEKDKWKSKINAQLAKAGELRAQFYSRKRTRTLNATMVKDYASQEVRYYHKGEVVESRTMTPEEYQMQLAEVKPGAPKTKALAQDTAPTKVKAKVLKVRDAGKAIAMVSGKKAKNNDIADVIRAESGRKTKHSAVDGAKA